MNLVWREPFRVRFYEADPDGRATVPAICRYLQEAADVHCRPFGFSVADLRAAGRMWVLMRLALRLTALPRVGDEIVVETWGTGRLGGVRAYRDFRVLDPKGQAMGEASSLWLFLDTTTRRPLRLPEQILRFRHPERAMTEPVDRAPLAAPARPGFEERVRVRWRDLDANGHANNVCYIEWALDTVPVAVRREASLAALDIQFLNEALLGEEVIAVAEQSGSCFMHGLTAAGGRPLARARTEWAYSGITRALTKQTLLGT